MALKPVVSGQTSLGDIGVSDTLNNVMTAYQAQLQNSPYTPPLGTQTAKNTQEAKDSSNPDTVFVNILDKPFLGLSEYIAKLNIGSDQVNSNQMNPLLKMKAVGDYTLISSELVFVTFSAVKISVDTYTSGATGVIASILSLKGSEILKIP